MKVVMIMIMESLVEADGAKSQRQYIYIYIYIYIIHGKHSRVNVERRWKLNRALYL